VAWGLAVLGVIFGPLTRWAAQGGFGLTPTTVEEHSQFCSITWLGRGLPCWSPPVTAFPASSYVGDTRVHAD
jgi:hypothetical protein